MNLDLTQIIVSFLAIIPVLYEIKKNKRDADAKHEEQISVSENTDKRLARLERQMQANNLQTCRIDLRQAIQHSPDNIPAVLELARMYFINYHGNADLGRKFLAWFKKYEVQKWADTHGEDVSNLIEAATHSG